MLYLPPQIAHHGVSMGDCITLSIGLRSPTHDEIWDSFAGHICDHITKEIHLDDPDMQLQSNPGEMKPEIINKLKSIISNYADDNALSDWFGKFSTEPKSANTVITPDEPITQDELISYLNSDVSIRWNEGSRFSYYLPSDNSNKIKLFYDGYEQQLNETLAPLVKLICSTNEILFSSLSPLAQSGQQMDLLLDLINGGHLYVEEE